MGFARYHAKGVMFGQFVKRSGRTARLYFPAYWRGLNFYNLKLWRKFERSKGYSNSRSTKSA